MVDFWKKINFLRDNLYDNCDNKLTEAFIPDEKPTSQQIRSRKVAIKSWIKDKRKNANFSHKYNQYPIAKLCFKDGRVVFPISAFDWSYQKFVDRYEKYKEDQQSHFITIKDYKYIYYYHEEIEDIAYFKIEYLPNDKIRLSTNHEIQPMSYRGEVKGHIPSSMLHFIVDNNDEMMFFSFSKLNLKLNFNVYGLCLSKAFHLRNPKTSMVLLSQDILPKERLSLFKTKLNPSNITIVNNEKEIIEQSFLNNLSAHIRSLREAVIDYSSQDIFLNLFLEEFTLFYQQFNSFYNQHEFQLSSFSKNIITILKLLKSSSEKHHLRIIYTIKDVNKSLFSSVDNTSMEMFNTLIETSKQKKMSFEFILLLGKKIIIDRELVLKLREFQEGGITLHFREYADAKYYSSLILIDDYKLAVSCLKEEKLYRVTRLSSEINKLKNKYNTQIKYTLSLEEILASQQAMNGEWYLYGHNSLNKLTSSVIEIDGLHATIYHNHKIFRGKIQSLYSDVLICSEFGIIKFKEHERETMIKIVSFLSDQDFGNRKPIMLFGILSKVEMKRDDIEEIFRLLIDRESSPYKSASFQLSLHIDAVLKPYFMKYTIK